MASSWNSDESCELTVNCRSRTGGVIELSVFDITVTGFMAEKRRWSVKPEDHILIKLPGLAYQPATVVWVEDETFGASFDQTLYEPVLAHMLETHQVKRFA